MWKNKLWCIIAIVLIGIDSTLAQTVVSNSTELEDALSSASAGDEIILKSQTWSNVVVDINASGTSDQPIIIRAESPQGVFFEGNSSVHIGGAYIVFDGVIFQTPSNLEVDDSRIDPIIEFRDLDNDVCNNCTVTNIKIDSYNGTEEQKEAVFKWIILYGQYNEISYSSFLGKYGVGSIINDNRNDVGENHNKIHHNYFAGRTPIDGFNEDNDQDAIRIGNSSTSLSDSYTEVYNNYFDDFSGEIEIISNKSGKNKYYNNTFRDYQGSLTLRHGDGCEVYGNYFFADGNTFTAGIRVIGEDHLIYNNYIEGINSKKDGGSSSGATGGINISNGRPDTELNGYYPVIGATIVNNTFVNCDLGIRVGTTVSSDLSIAPEDLTISNNIFLTTSNEAIEIETSPVNTVFEGNITQDGDWEITTGSDDNIEVESGLLEEGTDFYRLPEGSVAIDAGLGSFDFLTTDILGGTRGSSFDAGAEEFGSNGVNGPYTSEDIGVSIGFGAEEGPSLSASLETIELGKSAGTTTFDVTSNVNWTISSDVSWLTVDQSSGSDSGTITISFTENDEGADRSGSISITEDEEGVLSLFIPVTQLNQEILSLDDNLLRSGVSVFPNPIVNGQLNISSDFANIDRVRLFDLGGKTLVDTYTQGLKTSVDVSHLSPGIYILNLARLGSAKVIIK